MWPHKDGLGIRLSYGVDGNGVLVVDNSNKELLLEMKVAKLNQQGQILKEITGSYRLLDSVSPGAADMPIVEVPTGEDVAKVIHDLENSNHLDIPRCITSTYLAESSMSATKSYDPTLGEVTAIFNLPANKEDLQTKIFAFRSGISGNLLNLAVLKYKPVDFRESVTLDPLGVFEPYFSEQTKVSLSERIAQISTCDFVYGSISPFIIIRTTLKLYALECKVKRASSTQNSELKVDVSLVGEVDASQAGLDDFADISFNPWNYCQFAVVDIKGRFAIWNINKLHMKPIKRLKLDTSDCVPDVYDPAELSDWKRICWGKDMKTLLVLSRSSIHEFDLDARLQKNKLMTASTWSRIRDIYRVGKHAFLLTTKELIWFDVGESLSRKISWKLFLSDEDPSFKLSITSHDDRFICLIYSHISPLVFVYNFGIKDGVAFSLQDPYFILRKRNEPAVQIQLVKLNDIQVASDFANSTNSNIYYGLIELDIHSKLSITYYSELSDLQVIRTENSSNIIEQSGNTIKSIDTKETQYYYKFTRRLLSKVVKLMVDERIRVTDELTAIKKFAFYLGEGALKLNFKKDKNDTEKRYHSLIDFYPTVFPALKQINEFSSMLQQLHQFYESKSIASTSLLHEIITGQKSTLDSHNQANIVDYFTRLYFDNESLKPFNELNGLYSLVITLSAALTKAKSNSLSNFLLDDFNKTRDESPTEIKGLIDQWDYDDELYEPGAVSNPVSKPGATRNNGSKRLLNRSSSSQNSVHPLSQSTQVISQAVSKSILQNRSSSSQNSYSPLSQSTQDISQLSSQPKDSKASSSQKHKSSHMSHGSQTQRKRKKKKSGFA